MLHSGSYRLFYCNLATPAQVLLHSFSLFLPNLFCVSEVSDDVHQGIAAGTSLVFFSGAHVFTCSSLFFLCLVSFAVLRCFK